MGSIKDDLNAQSSLTAAPFGANDLQALTQSAPIMLSDHEAQIIRLYEVVLARVGLRSVSMPDGDDALDYVMHNPVSLIISELLRPHVNGLELLKAVRHDSATTEVPFIIITATPQYDSRQTFETLGGNAFLIKPIDARQLTQTVTHLLSAQLSKQPMS